MHPLQHQNATYDPKVSETDQQQEPERDITRQGQHDIGADNQHLVCKWIKNRAQTRYGIKALRNPSIEPISDAGDNKDNKCRPITAFIQEQDQDRYRTDPKKRQ